MEAPIADAPPPPADADAPSISDSEPNYDESHDEYLPSDMDDDGPLQDDDDDDDANQDNDATHRSKRPRDYHHLRIKATPDLPLVNDPKLAPSYREIGHTAHWSLSSTKPGNGIGALRDSSLDTYWQSDGLQPHTINIQFEKRQTVSAIGMYLDYSMDESYTPKKFVVRVGTTFHNLEEVRCVEVREPCGWCVVPLWRKWGEDVLDTILDPEAAESDEEDDDEKERKKKHHVPLWKRKPLRTHFVQIGIVSMHQNGRDTHVRQVSVFGPREDGSGGLLTLGGGRFGSSYRGLGGTKKKNGAAEMMVGSGRRNMPVFQTVGMSQFSSIR